MFRVTVLGEVLEPESIGDPHQGEAGGDDHEAFVAHRGAVWSLVLVGPAPVQHSLVKTAKKYMFNISSLFQPLWHNQAVQSDTSSRGKFVSTKEIGQSAHFTL